MWSIWVGKRTNITLSGHRRVLKDCYHQTRTSMKTKDNGCCCKPKCFPEEGRYGKRLVVVKFINSFLLEQQQSSIAA